MMNYSFTCKGRTVQYRDRDIKLVMDRVAWEFKGQLARGHWVHKPTNNVMVFHWKED